MALDLPATRAEALFCSQVQPSEKPDPVQVRESIAAMARKHGSRGCAALVAAEFGDHPDTAAARMVWARYMVAVVYQPRHMHTKQYEWCPRCWYTPERVAEIHTKVRKAMAAARDEPPSKPMTAAEVCAALGLAGN